MKPKINVTQLLSIAALAFTPAASGATLVFSATNFNDVNQLSTTGTLVDAAHFGADAEADVTANGILFVSRGVSSPTLTISEGTPTVYSNSTLYQAATHAVGYTDIVGMSATDEELMFDSCVFGSGVNNSLVTLSGLVSGKNYEIQLLLVDDRSGASATVSVGNATGGLSGPYDWSLNAVQLITGTFTADATTQTFRVAQLGANNVQINAYQLRQVPEPSAALLGGFGMLALLRRRRV